MKMTNEVEAFLMSEKLRGRTIKKPISPKDCYEFHIQNTMLWYNCVLVFGSAILFFLDTLPSAKSYKDFYKNKYDVGVDYKGTNEAMYEVVIEAEPEIIIKMLNNIETDLHDIEEIRHLRIRQAFGKQGIII